MLKQVSRTEWLRGFSRACRMPDGPIRLAYIGRLIETAPDTGSKYNALALRMHVTQQ